MIINRSWQFHGYQSFNLDEVSSEVAHEIGVKLV
mgnify:CR=1 FL=1